MQHTKYKNSEFTNSTNFQFPSDTILNPSDLIVFVPETINSFHTFTLRENALTLVFFANGKDPEMNQILNLVYPFLSKNNKLIIVDVGKIPDLGVKFQIHKPTLMKIYKGRVIQIFYDKFTHVCLDIFINKPKTLRWRKTIIR